MSEGPPTPGASGPRVALRSGALGWATHTAFWAAVLAVLLGGIISVSTLLQFEADADWVAHSHRVIERAQLVLNQTIDVQAGQRGYIISGDPEFLLPYEKARLAVEGDLRELRRLTLGTPAQESRVDALEELLAERLRIAQSLVELRRAQGFEVARELVAAGHGEELMTEIRGQIDALVDREQSLLIDRGRRSKESANTAVGAVSGLGGIAFTILGIAAARIRREVRGRARAQSRVEQLNTDLEQHSRKLAAEVVERTAAEQAVGRRNDELKAFAYTVSHDLKAPLRGISGYAQELERNHRAGLSDRAHFCIAQIITASKNLDALIDDLLRYARLDAEPLQRSAVVLPDLVDSVLRDHRLALLERGVEVTAAVPPLTIDTWERGLYQVMSNLVDNAIKYSRDSKPPRLIIRGERTGGGVTVSVSDNGIGFDMKYHDRIFGLFNRLVRAADFDGTGAGLAIVKKVVLKLGGTIRAQSTSGQGATFFVDLPLSGPEDPEP